MIEGHPWESMTEAFPFAPQEHISALSNQQAERSSLAFDILFVCVQEVPLKKHAVTRLILAVILGISQTVFFVLAQPPRLKER